MVAGRTLSHSHAVADEHAGTAARYGRGDTHDHNGGCQCGAGPFDSAINHRRIIPPRGGAGGISILLGLSTSALFCSPCIPTRLRAESMAHPSRLFTAWPVVPALGLLWRWSVWRTIGGVAAYLLCLVPIILLGSNAAQTLTMVVGWLASTVALLMVSLLGLAARGASGRWRRCSFRPRW